MEAGEAPDAAAICKAWANDRHGRGHAIALRGPVFARYRPSAASGLCQLGIGRASRSAASATLASAMGLVNCLLVLALAPPGAFPAGSALEARVELRSGQVHSGTLTAADEGSLTLRAGEQQLSLRLDDVLLLSLAPSRRTRPDRRRPREARPT